MSGATLTSVGNAVGFYGKLPAAGDFVTRGLPSTFVAPWDDWLQRSLLASQSQLGDRWTAIYLESPIWCFAVQPQVCGPLAWTGVVMPSVDRAGRYFPLTIAAPIDASASMLLTMTGGERWYPEVEQAALATLKAGATVASLEAALARLPLQSIPATAQGHDDWAIAQELSRWWARPESSYGTQLAAPRALTTVAEFAAIHFLETQTNRHTLWWRRYDDDGAVAVRAWKGMPSTREFTLLMHDSQNALR